MNFWKKGKSQLISNANSGSKPGSFVLKSVPGEVREDAAETINSERKFISWVDEAFHEYERNDGFKDLPGKGKPLHLDEAKGDPLYGILKNANALPSWLVLQHEIRDAIRRLLDTMDKGKEVDVQFEIDEINEINEINKKITKYNNQVPNVYFQKSKLTIDNLPYQVDKWD